MISPYDTLAPSAFWRTGVATEPPAAVRGLYVPKFAITKDMPIMTAGSCFAQHLHRNLVARAWSVLDFESPHHRFNPSVIRRYGYGQYSARYGNIYSVRQMVQLLHEAYDLARPHAQVWQRPDGKYIDAQRPSIEPDGYDTPDLVTDARDHHLLTLRKTFECTELLIFTLGLTETWRHTATGTVYPTAPGVIGAPPDPKDYSFHNAGQRDIMADLATLNDFGKSRHPNFKLLLTVSPVPLTATATGGHVLPASTYSKAVLRSAAGEFARAHENVDYFPSFELITSSAAKGQFFEPNQRSVKACGVANAMAMFFRAHGENVDDTSQKQGDPGGVSAPHAGTTDMADDGDDAVQCEEVLLDAKNRIQP